MISAAVAQLYARTSANAYVAATLDQGINTADNPRLHEETLYRGDLSLAPLSATLWIALKSTPSRNTSATQAHLPPVLPMNPNQKVLPHDTFSKRYAQNLKIKLSCRPY